MQKAQRPLESNMVLQPLLVQRGFTMPKCGLLVPTRGAEEAAMDLLSPEEDAVEDLKRRMVGTKNDIQQRLLTNSWRFSWQTQLAKQVFPKTWPRGKERQDVCLRHGCGDLKGRWLAKNAQTQLANSWQIVDNTVDKTS
jgi:hypothetical protein